MKSLGYGRLISLDNFRTPNFELVADILYFFCDRISSSIDLSDDISTKLKRVEFIKNCANILASTTQIKLKLKNIYKADGYAVKELLKIANFLNNANNINEKEIISKIKNIHSLSTNNNNKLNKLRNYTNLGSKIIENGVKLHNLLNNNNNNKNKIINEKVILFLEEMSHNIENYDNVIKKNISIKLNNLINDIDDQINDLSENKLSEITENISILQKKIENKTNELERLNKRLLSLRNIKPSFIEEYEILEEKNIEIYNLYCDKFRNLSYLQSCLNKYRIIEYEKEIKTKKKLKSVQKKLRQQELKLLTNNNDINDINDDVDDLDIYDVPTNEHTNRGDRGRNDNRFSTTSTTPNSRRTGTDTGTLTGTHSGSQTPSHSTDSRSSITSNSSPRQSNDDGSIGSISDIGDEHMQF